MIFKDHPKQDLYINLMVIAVSILILFFAILPFLNIENSIIKVGIITLALVFVAYPLIHQIYKDYKKGEAKQEDKKNASNK